MFFNNLQEVLVKYSISAQNIFNLDETGLSTVQKPTPVFAQAGVKQVGKITSRERGETITMCACINALGNFLPPAFIFPRVHFKEHMLKGAPTGSFGTTCPSGWMNNDIFPNVLLHFLKFMNISKSNPGLLILDNHQSHIGLETITIAEENGLSILTFPPHCSHRLQPLDVSVFGAFKCFYNRFCDAWMTSHPGKLITIYEVGELAGSAFVKAFTPENITSGFKKTGIYPFNSEVFTDDMFLPTYVTDININSNNDKNQQLLGLSTNTSDSINSSSNESILVEAMPYPKTSKNVRPNARQMKSSVITDTAEKLRRFPHLLDHSSSSESDSEMILETDSDTLNDSSSKEESSCQNISPAVAVCSFIVTKVFSNKRSKNFIAQIIGGPDKDNDYEVKFMKRSSKVRNGFIFPEEDDLASTSYKDLVCVLTQPSPVAHTSRLSNIFKFSENLASYNIN